MTSLADPRAQAARRVDGRVWPVDGRVLVCRYPVSTSLPIPLSVRFPAGTDLVTWVFAGIGHAEGKARTGKPVALLVLALRDAQADTALRDAGAITVETHFHDIEVVLAGTDAGEGLTGLEREALCAAILAAVTPETLPALSPLFPLLRPIIDALPVATSAPELTVAGAGEGMSLTLAGFKVPNYLLLSAGGELSCARVASARLRPGARARADLTLETVWGVPAPVPPDRVVMLTNGHFTPARLRAAETAR